MNETSVIWESLIPTNFKKSCSSKLKALLAQIYSIFETSDVVKQCNKDKRMILEFKRKVTSLLILKNYYK